MRREFELRVEPADEPPFEATVKQDFNDLRGWHMPDVGWSVTVIYDPTDHSKIVIDVNVMPVGPGRDRDAAVVLHERALRRQSHEDAPGDRSEPWRAIALDPTLSPEEKRAKAMELSANMAAGARTPFVGGRTTLPGSGPEPAAAIDALAKLADLRDRGVLTAAEFEAQKAKILGSR